MISDDALALDQFLAGQIFTSRAIWTNLQILCDDLGDRI